MSVPPAEHLCINGFGEVWHEQGVGDQKQVFKTLKQRLTDIFMQECFHQIRDRVYAE